MEKSPEGKVKKETTKRQNPFHEETFFRISPSKFPVNPNSATIFDKNPNIFNSNHLRKIHVNRIKKDTQLDFHWPKHLIDERRKNKMKSTSAKFTESTWLSYNWDVERTRKQSIEQVSVTRNYPGNY